MPVSPAAVASLRARTGVSMMACKEALEEAGGDEEKAIEILRKRGIAQAAKKAARDQAEGLVFMKEGSGKAGVVLIRCETDFVARDAGFQAAGKELVETLVNEGEAAAKAKADKVIPDLVQKLGENISLGEARLVESPVLGAYLHSNAKIGVLVGMSKGTGEQAKDVAMHAAAASPSYVKPEEVTADMVAKEKEIWAEQLKKEGKPAEMLDKIMMGKEKKYREENALLTQPFVKDPSKTVQKYLGDAEVTSYVRVAVG